MLSPTSLKGGKEKKKKTLSRQMGISFNPPFVLGCRRILFIVLCVVVFYQEGGGGSGKFLSFEDN